MGQSSEIATITETASNIISSNSLIKRLTITNTGSATVYLGTDNAVTDTTGFPITTGEVLEGNDYIGNWYAICASSENSNLRIDTIHQYFILLYIPT